MKQQESAKVSDSRSDYDLEIVYDVTRSIHFLHYGLQSSSIRRINQLSPSNRNNSRQARERHAYFAQPDTQQITCASETREEVVKCETELVSSR